ncbi:MAG: nuclear transport factor 2 family protein [Thermoleophilia bacterium]
MPTSLPEPVQRVIDAVNAGDGDAFVAAFTEIGAVNDRGREFPGRMAIREWSDAELIGRGATLAPTAATVEGNRVAVVATVGGDGLGSGTFTFTLSGPRVSRMAITE